MTYEPGLQTLLEKHQVLLGCAVDSASPDVAEMAGMLGYDLVWADLEHGSVGPREAQTFCQGAKAGGALPVLRIPNADRVHILHALEAGARLIVVPMIESPETAREIVEHGKYAPRGKRGFNGATRGLQYGIGDRLENIEWANRETHLFVQIETVEAVRRCSEIVAVEGITGGLVGPADLSFSMGKPLAFDDPEVLSLFAQAVRKIRAAGKIAATATAAPHLVKAGVEAGLQIIICATEMSSLRSSFDQTLRDVSGMIRSISC